MKLACLLLILLTLAAVMHVHNDVGLDASRPCPVCVAIHCAIITAVLVALASQAARPRRFALVDCTGISPLLTSDLFIRPPPAA